MSTMANTAKSRRPRRRFTEEFKAGAVRLVLEEGQTVGRVSRELDLTESAVRNWVDHARADRTRRWCADSARWASSGRHVDHRDRRRGMISL